MLRKLWCSLLLLSLPALGASIDLDTVLAHMDKAAISFRSSQANISRLKYTKIVDDKDIESGMIYVLKNKKKTLLLIEFTDPYPYFLAVNGNKAEIYRPRIATVEEYDLSNSREMFEQVFLLGFGTTGKYLRENYELKLEGEETAAGKATVKLELIPKSEKMLKYFPRLEMWISTGTWQVVQQRFDQPSAGDYRVFTYTNVAVNPKLSEKQFKLKIPKNTKRVFPGK